MSRLMKEYNKRIVPCISISYLEDGESLKISLPLEILLFHEIEKDFFFLFFFVSSWVLVVVKKYYI